MLGSLFKYRYTLSFAIQFPAQGQIQSGYLKYYETTTKMSKATLEHIWCITFDFNYLPIILRQIFAVLHRTNYELFYDHDAC